MSIRSLLRDTVLRTSQTKFGGGTAFTLDTDLAWPTVISTTSRTANAITWSSDGKYYYSLEGEKLFQFTTPYIYGPVEKTIRIASSPDYSLPPVAHSSMQLSIDGTKLYLSRESSIDQYTLPKPYFIDSFYKDTTIDIRNYLPFDDSTIKNIKFNDDGNMLFVSMGQNAYLYKFVLSTPWDLNTIQSVPVFVNTRTLKSEGICFANAGYDLYVGVTHGAEQYRLKYPYDLSNVTYFGNINLSNYQFTYAGDDVTGIDVSPDGTKLYLTKLYGVIQVNLNSPYNILTANLQTNIRRTKTSVTTETSMRAIDFSSDGRKLFILGTVRRNVEEFSLSEAFNPNTAVIANSFPIATREATPTGFRWGNTGFSFYVCGSGSDRIHQFNCSQPFNANTSTYIGNIRYNHAPFTPYPTNIDGGLEFNSNGNVLLISSGTGTTNTILPIRLRTPWNISTALHGHANLMIADPDGMFMSPQGNAMFILYTANINQYRIDIPWEMGNAVYQKHNTNIPTQIRGNILSFSFSSDGSNLYLGSNTHNINQCTLASPWDIGTITFAANLNLNVVGANIVSPSALSFSSDGTKMFIGSDTRDRIYQYNLSIPWNITTGSNVASFSIAGTETNIRDLRFSPNGDRMYVIGFTGDSPFEYRLPNVWTLDSSITLVSSAPTQYDTSPAETQSVGLSFSSDGKRLYTLGKSVSAVRTFYLANAWSSADGYEGFSVPSTWNLKWSASGNTFYITRGTGPTTVTGRIHQYIARVPYDVYSIDFANIASTIYPRDWIVNEGVDISLANNYITINGTSDAIIQFFRYKGGATSPDSGLDKINIPLFYTTSVTTPNMNNSRFSSDGGNLFLGTTTGIYSYKLDTPGDLTTFANTTNQPILSTRFTNAENFSFTNNGSNLIYLTDTGRLLHEHSLVSPYNLNNATYLGNVELLPSFPTPLGLYFDEGNKKIYISDSNDGIIFKFHAPLANSIFGLSFTNYAGSNIFSFANIDVIAPNVNANVRGGGFDFSFDGKKLFFVKKYGNNFSTANSLILEYDLNPAWDIGYASDPASNTTSATLDLSRFATGTIKDFDMARFGGRYLLLDDEKLVHVEQAPTAQLFFNKTEYAQQENIPTVLDVQYLVVAGGGGGGSVAGPSAGHGGGAGGMLEGNLTLTLDSYFTQYPIVIGAGGAIGAPGANSSLGGNLVISYGGGGGEYPGNNPGFGGSNGGSGSGGGSTLDSRQGNPGGPNDNPSYGGGGGGANQAGGVPLPSTAGDGRISRVSPGGYGDLQPAGVYFAGGGGGGGPSSSPGGLGGGGRGAVFNSPPNNARTGETNTGGGGGGFRGTTANQGNTGGSGIVILKYPGNARFTGGIVESNSGFTVHIFKSSNTLVKI